MTVRRLVWVFARLVAGCLLLGTLAFTPVPGHSDQVVVAIDPGHGGIDPGAIADSMTEKEVVLNFSKRLAAQIDLFPQLRAHLIRNDDSFLTLSERIRIARANGANILISIHADTTSEGRAEGAHVYTLSPEGTDEAASDLAERENRADVLGGTALAGEADDLAALLIDLAQRGTSDEAAKLAQRIVASLATNVTMLPTQPHRQANFRVLKAPELPSVLIELGYLSNAEDRARMASDIWIQRMAAALAEGINQWTQIASPGYLSPKK